MKQLSRAAVFVQTNPKSERIAVLKHSVTLSQLEDNDTDVFQKSLVSRYVGTSTWLTTLPLQERGFNLNKQEFHDALRLCYGRQLKNLPSHCVCGSLLSIDNAMIYSHGGLTITRHNEIRDITANCLSKVCTNVEREPMPLPLMGETTVPLSANRRDDAHADIWAMGFWGHRQCSFFNIRVFHPNAQSYRHSSIHSLYRQHELSKESMETELEKLRMVLLLHWYLLGREKWVEKLHHSTNNWQTWLQIKSIQHIARQWHG